jgi:hypothetical protein
LGVGQFATTLRRTIITKGAYIRTNSKEGVARKKSIRKWLPISKGKKSKFSRMMKLGISSFLHNKIKIII